MEGKILCDLNCYKIRNNTSLNIIFRSNGGNPNLAPGTCSLYDESVPMRYGNTNISNISIIHQNIQSLHSNYPLKGDAILHNIEQSLTPIDCFMLSETWIDDYKTLRKWIQYSSIKKIHTIISDINNSPPVNNRGKGTAIIINNHWMPYVQAEKYLLPGRVTGITLKKLNETYLIACIYFPAGVDIRDPERMVVTKFITKMKNKQPLGTKIILMGDFNAAVNPSIFLNQRNKSRTAVERSNLITKSPRNE
jgi:exonuclease III